MAHGKFRVNQQGIASILITMIMMIVISLIVVAFAQVSRREQTEALNNQLSSQAYYAAESGINDARQIIKSKLSDAAGDYNAAAMQLNFPTCSSFPTISSTPPANTLTSDGTVKYTCVTINPYPATLSGSAVGDSGSVFRISTKSGSLASSGIKISWSPSNTGIVSPSCPATTSLVFSANADWQCPFGVLRLDLVKTDGVALNSGSLINNMNSIFAVPASGVSGTIPASGGIALQVNSVSGGCTPVSQTCSIIINGLSGNEYFLRAQLLYGAKSSITVTRVDGFGNPFPSTDDNDYFAGSEVVVDATGKAQNVERRVRVSMNMFGSTPALDNAAIQSGSGPCKKAFISKDESNVETVADPCAIPNAN